MELLRRVHERLAAVDEAEGGDGGAGGGGASAADAIASLSASGALSNGELLRERACQAVFVDVVCRALALAASARDEGRTAAPLLELLSSSEDVPASLALVAMSDALATSASSADEEHYRASARLLAKAARGFLKRRLRAMLEEAADPHVLGARAPSPFGQRLLVSLGALPDRFAAALRRAAPPHVRRKFFFETVVREGVSFLLSGGGKITATRAAAAAEEEEKKKKESNDDGEAGQAEASAVGWALGHVLGKAAVVGHSETIASVAIPSLAAACLRHSRGPARFREALVRLPAAVQERVAMAFCPRFAVGESAAGPQSCSCCPRCSLRQARRPTNCPPCCARP